MTHWNYRVVRASEDSKPGEDYYAIYEVYYNDKQEVVAWTENEVAPMGITPDELAADLRHMAEALVMPILDITKMPTPVAAVSRDDGPDIMVAIDGLMTID